MTTIISGSSPSITFSDSTTQTTAFTSTPSVTSITTSADASINGLTVGRGAGAVSSNTAVGATALAANTSGTENVAVGNRAAESTTTSSDVTAVGFRAGRANSTGNVTAFGAYALDGNTTGVYNTALGNQALASNTTASNNTAVGYQAGYTGNGTYFQYSTLIGYQAGYTSSPSSASSYGNTCIGARAGYSLTTGYGNIVVGGIGSGGTDPSGFSLTTGINNTFVGPSSGNAVTTGSKNTILGSYTGNQGGLDIRTASNNVVLSDGDGNPRFNYISANKSWQMPYFGGTSTSRGGNTILSMNSGSNTYDGSIAMTDAVANNVWWGLLNGNAYVMTNSLGVNLSSGATSWASASDSRLKNVTGTYLTALSDIAQIDVVKFTWKSDEKARPCVGVIAQSVQGVVPEAVDEFTENDEQYLSVRYTELIPLMIASIKELNTLVTAQATEIQALKAKVGI